MSDAQRILDVAKAEVGYHEGRNANGEWTNKQKYSGQVPGLEWSDYQPWCATFVSWCAMKAGLDALYPRTASCLTGVAWFKARGRFSEYPAVGAQVFFGPGGGTHTELAYAYDAKYVYTVGGNTNDRGSANGDGVYYRKHERRSDYVYGYGYPAFAEGIVSADPEWGGKSGGGNSTPPAPSYEPFPGAAWFKRNPRSAIVTAMGKRLVAEGCSAYSQGPGAQWTDADKKSYAKWQRKLGYSGSDADGWPGAKSWDALRVPKS